MRKIVCTALIICFLPVCSLAADLTEFNANAVALGEKAISESDGTKTGDVIIYTVGDCSLTFDETVITIQGDGTSFLAYAMAAIMVYDHNPDTFTDNAGKLFSAFLLAKNNGLQHQMLSTGSFFFINNTDYGFLFVIGR